MKTDNKPDKRASRGNTFTYLVVALASVVENLRQIATFYKRQLATVPLRAKNKHIPSIFWRGERPTSEARNTDSPPG
jgi:hypothetical protein